MQTKEISLRLSQDLYERIQREAEEQDRSISHIIRQAVEAYLEATALLAGKEQ
jgi:predicted transcriptional regulator